MLPDEIIDDESDGNREGRDGENFVRDGEAEQTSD